MKMLWWKETTVYFVERFTKRTAARNVYEQLQRDTDDIQMGPMQTYVNHSF